MTGTVYLLHFDQPFKHAKHYTGWTADLAARLAQHRAGQGARLVAVIQAAGIGFELARTWPGSRTRERQIKRQGGASRCCPMCGVTPRAVHQEATCQHKPCAICEGPWQGTPVSAAEVSTWPAPPF